jgi:hypothetical protein
LPSEVWWALEARTSDLVRVKAMHGERRESICSIVFEFYSDRCEPESPSASVFRANQSHCVSGKVVSEEKPNH